MNVGKPRLARVHFWLTFFAVKCIFFNLIGYLKWFNVKNREIFLNSKHSQVNPKNPIISFLQEKRF